MFVTTIIPTINRPSLTRAVCSVLDQRFSESEFQVIVVNDSGLPLPDYKWLSLRSVQVINTQKHNRSVARNVGAAAAKGKYLHFLDDDDWILPNAFTLLSNLSKSTQAHLIYGGYKLVDTAGNLLRECHPDEEGNCLIRFLAGEWLPLQVSLIRSDTFFRIGGFSPLESIGGGNEDVDLLRKLSLTQDIKGIPEVLGVIRFGKDNSTTEYTNLTVQSRVSREHCLSEPIAFSRIRHSAKTRSRYRDYWRGRSVWTYFTSVIWNIQNRQFLRALGRATLGGFSVLMSVHYFTSPRFWRGATRPHQTKGWLDTVVF